MVQSVLYRGSSIDSDSDSDSDSVQYSFSSRVVFLETDSGTNRRTRRFTISALDDFMDGMLMPTRQRP